MNPRPKQPNVLLVVMDDMAFGDLACHGNPHTSTPHLDALHAESVRLTRYSSGPLCTPARAALMTGRHPYRTRAIDTYCGRSIIDPDERTLPQVLGDAGYTCGLFGKWHLGDNLPSRPRDLGFHETLHHAGGGLNQPANLGRDSYFDADLIRNGTLGPSRGYCTDVFTDGALAFIDRHQDAPWLCYLATNAPHSPFAVPEQYVEPYRQAGLPEVWARLYGMVTNIDANVGRLLKRLDERGLADNTLVVFTSDHGPCPSATLDGQIRFNASLRGLKGTMYEGGIRVPCFWRWPDTLPAGRDVDRLANPIDLLPTLAGFCGAQVPDDRAIDGADLGALLTGATRPEAWPDREICMQWHRGDLPQTGRNAATLGQRYKWYWPEHAEQAELYDLEKDPAEQRDLADQLPDRAAAMRATYEAWFADVSHTRGETLEENYAPPPILIGDGRENPSVLTRQDMRLYDTTPEGWGDQHPGYWWVNVTRPGLYCLTVDLPPHAGPATLTLRCGDWSKDVALTTGCLTVGCDNVALPTGDQRLEALLVDAHGDRLAVKYLRVARLATVS